MTHPNFRLQKVKHTLAKVNALASEMRGMSDEELKHQTVLLKKELANGKTVDDILPRAFATIREADYRILGMFPYDVQVMGAIVLNQGNIAEMKTGEGKTLTATMPLYLNALTGKGTFLLTPNNYLAQRDKEQLQPVYEWLGLTVSLGFEPDDQEKKTTPAIKRSWYNADITYTTASSLAFDYLFNNLATRREDQYLRPFNYVIIDEVDAILLDEATSPFVVSSMPMVQSNLYQLADAFIHILQPKIDYRLNEDHDAVWLTLHGIQRAERFFRIPDLFISEYREIYRHIILALRAHFIMENGHDYLVSEGEVILLDEANGRLKKGVKVSTGLHQAIEAKEHVDLTPNQQVAASITFPSLFGLFNKIAGMSGTAKSDEHEFFEVYKMRVIQIPTRKKVIRKDYPEQIYLTTRQKLIHALDETIELHKAGRPVLLVAGSVENSEIISELLLDRGISHNVLNAFNVAREADIVKDAGQKGAVTVATNMAGRGTDIKLGAGVKKLGGLAVIGTEMLPARVKMQLAGRAGRQGDPGTSKFYISLEDSYLAKNSTKRFKNYYRRLRKKKTDKQLRSPRLKMSVTMLNDRVAANQQMARSNINKNEIALKIQRKYLYDQRDQLMRTAHLETEVGKWLSRGISLYLTEKVEWTALELRHLMNQHFTYDVVSLPDTLELNHKKTQKYLERFCQERLEQKAQVLINNKQLNQFYRSALLNALDSSWTDQMAYLSKLSVIVQPWATAQRDPKFMYQEKAYQAFEKMFDTVAKKVVDNLMLSTIRLDKDNNLIVHFN
ncbi:accessory Sec system translocase SecA2 [Limosilactobacillus reuteri]|uniref:accessory Sec system translocase SecA2 n=1 Tax=Limosilactobacillus reuteri TaxID=1598 RepID=UPI001E3D77B5|nr:accessory Sec system translocase SecA2 [Limosilactobacillus reuteri]MCC4343269.1 accessory Sec system translocase SecA2 [Limosilactobacillus reuteri]MCC4355771.1 accessory Sec system translocase SecA2 [Limosilactobacillus reuteri]